MKMRMEFDLKRMQPWSSNFKGTVFRIGDTTPRALGELLLDAYQETVDYEGETLDDAVAEVSNVLRGGYGDFSETYSAFIGPPHQPHAALFVVEQNGDELFIPYVVTAKRASRRGFASALILRCLRLALVTGKQKVTLYVTESNRPAVALYEKLGFTEVYLPLPMV